MAAIEESMQGELKNPPVGGGGTPSKARQEMLNAHSRLAPGAAGSDEGDNAP